MIAGFHSIGPSTFSRAENPQHTDVTSSIGYSIISFKKAFHFQTIPNGHHMFTFASVLIQHAYNN